MKIAAFVHKYCLCISNHYCVSNHEDKRKIYISLNILTQIENIFQRNQFSIFCLCISKCYCVSNLKDVRKIYIFLSILTKIVYIFQINQSSIFQIIAHLQSFPTVKNYDPSCLCVNVKKYLGKETKKKNQVSIKFEENTLAGLLSQKFYTSEIYSYLSQSNCFRLVESDQFSSSRNKFQESVMGLSGSLIFCLTKIGFLLGV